MDKTGRLSFDGNRYEAPPGLEGRRAVELAHPIYRGLDRVHHPQPSRPAEPAIPYLDLLLQRRRERQTRAMSPLRLSLLANPEVRSDVWGPTSA